MSETAKADNVATMPTKAGFKKLKDCTSLAEAFDTKELKDIMNAAIPKHLNAETMLRAFIQAASKTPLIYKCDLRQSLGAFMSLTYLGLVPGTVLQQSHLIPFARRKKVKGEWVDAGYDLNLIIGYPGYVELAFRSGFIKDIATGVVFPGEVFDYEKGSERFIRHKPNIDLDTSSLTPRGCYAIAQFLNEGEEFEIMSWTEILGIRNRSQSYRTALAAKERAEDKSERLPNTWLEAAWVRDAPEMGRKTVLRRLAKLLPKCPELRAGIGIEDAQEGGHRLDFGTVIDGTATPMDGIPDVPEDEQPDPREPVRQGRDPGAAHTDRRREEPPTAQRQPEPPPPESTPEFEAVLIDQYGDVMNEPYRNPVAFARDLVALWNGVNDNTDWMATITENNEDAIGAARAFPEAARILAVLDEEPPLPGDDGDGEKMPADDPIILAVSVPMKGDKLDWPAYRHEFMRVMATAMITDAWWEAQRQTIEGMPAGQRPLLLEAIEQFLRKNGLFAPDWLIALKPKAKAAKQESQADDDEAWVETQLRDLEAIPLNAQGAAIFDTAVKGAMKTMQRLKVEKPELFAKAKVAFDQKHARLSVYRRG